MASIIAFDFFLIRAYKSVSNVDWNAMTFQSDNGVSPAVHNYVASDTCSSCVTTFASIYHEEE